MFYSPFVIQQSRGCPYTCDFCAERRLNGDYGYRDRPPEEMVEEIRKCGGHHIFFAASQFVGHKARTMELLEALIPLKIRWSALFSPRFGLDAKFLDLAKRSGLLHVNMGIESISQNTLQAMHKTFNHSHSYEDMIENLNKRNISYSFNFVFGADADDEDIFPTTLKFLQEHKVPAAYFNVMAPLRGTPIYDRMKQRGPPRRRAQHGPLDRRVLPLPAGADVGRRTGGQGAEPAAGVLFLALDAAAAALSRARRPTWPRGTSTSPSARWRCNSDTMNEFSEF